MQSLTAMGANSEIDSDDDGALIGDSTLREIMRELREMSSTALAVMRVVPTIFLFWVYQLKEMVH